ncbi:MAG: fumarate hydratase [Firmicutes bacterium HGW-Firmicutes-1]|jgi:fumarate hydratase subunit alpha|nr:MAG: fumarate hydratase [Firmicutes bacterium HGW-Firmicutes-1]
MREIGVNEIINVVKELCIDSNYNISKDILCAFQEYYKKESSEIGKEVLDQLIENSKIASEKQMPICQDTGMAVVFFEIGQEVRIVDGDLSEAIHEGVRRGYEEGYLRKSVVRDPFFRENTKDNTPAIIHYDIVKGENIKITIAPKGFGSENMSRIYMLTPSDGMEGAKRVILETIEAAGGNACPPMVVGVGIGGTFEKAAILAKKALLRPVGDVSKIEYVKELEKELLNKANELGIGPQGLGGNTTVLGVKVEVFPTHIAGLPVAINISCHVTRHSTRVI